MRSMKKNSKFVKLIQKFNLLKILVLQDIWKFETKDLPFFKKLYIGLLRSFVLAYRGFKEDKVRLRAASLTFFSVLSVVPVLAMVFGLAKGFGMEERLKVMLQEALKGQEEVANFLINFASNMLDNVKGGLVFGIGLAFLFWSVMKVLGNIENAFNGIWQVKRSRVFLRKFSDYFSMMLVSVLLFVLSSSAQVVIIQMIDRIMSEISFIGFFRPVINMLVKATPYVLVWLLFTVIYMVMPNTKVKFSSALLAGIIAGSLFQVLQWGYFHFQIGVSRYNAVYGGFAALPLFLVWLNWSWLIVLFGAEVSFAAQNHYQYEFESDIKAMNIRSHQIISVYVFQLIVTEFIKGGEHLTSIRISEILKLPVRIVNHVLYELVEVKFLVETPTESARESAFLPARDVHALSINDVVRELNAHGHDISYLQKEENTLSQIVSSFDDGDSLLQGFAGNKKLKDIG